MVIANAGGFQMKFNSFGGETSTLRWVRLLDHSPTPVPYQTSIRDMRIPFDQFKPNGHELTIFHI